MPAIDGYPSIEGGSSTCVCPCASVTCIPTTSLNCFDENIPMNVYICNYQNNKTLLRLSCHKTLLQMGCQSIIPQTLLDRCPQTEVMGVNLV